MRRYGVFLKKIGHEERQGFLKNMGYDEEREGFLKDRGHVEGHGVLKE